MTHEKKLKRFYDIHTSIVVTLLFVDILYRDLIMNYWAQLPWKYLSSVLKPWYVLYLFVYSYLSFIMCNQLLLFSPICGCDKVC